MWVGLYCLVSFYVFRFCLVVVPSLFSSWSLVMVCLVSFLLMTGGVGAGEGGHELGTVFYSVGMGVLPFLRGF